MLVDLEICEAETLDRRQNDLSRRLLALLRNALLMLKNERALFFNELLVESIERHLPSVLARERRHFVELMFLLGKRRFKLLVDIVLLVDFLLELFLKRCDLPLLNAEFVRLLLKRLLTTL